MSDPRQPGESDASGESYRANVFGDVGAFSAALASSPTIAGAQHVLRISGELDMATAHRLEEALAPLSGPIVVDCTSLLFMDAAGIGVLVRALQHVESIKLINTKPIVRKLFTIAGLQDTFFTDEITGN